MTQVPSATQIVEKENNLLKDNGIEVEKYDPTYYREVYIACKNVQSNIH